ncbi:unnamed protein product, partial [Eretmochelys imbricata]
FLQLQEFLEKRFPKQLEITGEMAPGSGAFEVLLPDSGEVLHSKINGDGYVDSNAKVQRICEGISKVLKQ